MLALYFKVTFFHIQCMLMICIFIHLSWCFYLLFCDLTPIRCPSHRTVLPLSSFRHKITILWSTTTWLQIPQPQVLVTFFKWMEDHTTNRWRLWDFPECLQTEMESQSWGCLICPIQIAKPQQLQCSRVISCNR